MITTEPTDLRGPDENWRDQAVCTGLPTDLWYPEHNDSEATITAKSLCFECPVRLLCLDFALDSESGSARRFGIFGGLSAKQRGRYVGGDLSVLRVPTFRCGHRRNFANVLREDSGARCRSCADLKAAA